MLDEEAKPVKGAVVKLGPLNAPTAQATTDDGGNFLMQNPPVGANQLLFIDGGPASTPEHSFPIVPYKVTITAGQANTLGFTPHLHFQKTTGLVDIANSAVERVVSDPEIPGFAMRIPAGATITGWDGQANMQVSVRRVPIDRIPLPPLPSEQKKGTGYFLSGLRRGGKVTGCFVKTPSPAPSPSVGRGKSERHPAYRGVVLTQTASGHSLRWKDGAIWTFGAPTANLAFLTQQADRNGNTLTFTRTGTLGRLDAITDTAGRPLTFTYDGGDWITRWSQ